MEVFKVLKKEHGESFGSYFWDKVYTLKGYISLEHLGIDDDDLRETLWKEVDVITTQQEPQASIKGNFVN